MTITLDIRPEVEAEFTRRAKLAGSALETYAADSSKTPSTSLHLTGCCQLKLWSRSSPRFVG